MIVYVCEILKDLTMYSVSPQVHVTLPIMPGLDKVDFCEDIDCLVHPFRVGLKTSAQLFRVVEVPVRL